MSVTSPLLSQNARNFSGNDFWVAFPQNSNDPIAPFNVIDILIIPESRDTIHVQEYRLNRNFDSVVIPGKYNRIQIQADWMYYDYYPTNVFLPKRKVGIRIQGKRNFTVQAYNLVSGSNGGSSIYPSTVLENGQEYVVNSWPGTSLSQAAQTVIMAIDPGKTHVDIELASSIVTGPSAGYVISDSLQQGECYYLMADRKSDMSGTKITVRKSCKKLAVFTGARCARVLDTSACGSCDHIFEQVLPKAYASKLFVHAGLKTDSVYQLSVVPVANATTVWLNGINKGVFGPSNPYKVQIKSLAAQWIESDKPVIVSKISNSSGCNGGTNNTGDPSLVILSSVGNGIKKAALNTQVNPNPTTHFLQVYVEKFNTPNLKLNNLVFTPNNGWKNSSLNGKKVWYGDYKLTNNTNYVLTASDTGFWAYLTGQAISQAYSLCLAANISNKFADFHMSTDALCNMQDPVTFTASGDSVNQIAWHYGDGNTGTGTSSSHIYSKPGTYIVKMINARSGNFCGADTVRKKLIVYPTPQVYLDKDTHPCMGNTLRIELSDKFGYKYNWSDGSVGPIKLIFKDQKLYLSTTDTNGCVKKDSINVQFKDCNKTKLKISNIFSPNNDAFNDKWRIIYEGYDVIQVKIINRYGAIVAKYVLPDHDDWNGRVQNTGGECPEGMYYYEVEAIQNRTKKVDKFKGGVYLVR